MENVVKIENSKAQEALEILEQAWAYFMPEAKPAQDLAPKDEPQNFSYYEAA